MKNPPKVKAGDRVRVVLEGEVSDTPLSGNAYYLGTSAAGNVLFPTAEHVVSIEVLPPPVEVFGPGDTVRHKRLPGRVHTLTEYGYWDHNALLFRGAPRRPRTFTSEHYERVRARFFEVDE